MIVSEIGTGRFERTRMLCAKLIGVRESCESRESILTQRVADAKGRLTLVEDVDNALDQLQNRAHRRSVGVFEKLLSAIVHDVLPDKGDVCLKLYQERGAPALDIMIDNGGELEDAFDGSGGAITNVISAGLRFAALSRTSARRFMVLDEPDCWLKPDRITAFVRVLSDVARRTGTQTILISHHDPEYFEDLVNLVSLTRDEDGQPKVGILHTVEDWQDDATPGIRSLHLKNFRAHKDTYLPLFPGVTALIGDNDIGKSTLIASSLRAVAYGVGDDTLIRHGEIEATVAITVENGTRIAWTRREKVKGGESKVNYALFQKGSDQPVKEGRPPGRGSAPTWVTDTLGIELVDNLDIQIGNQKSPVFLLDQPASRRAQILSVGRESGKLSALIERYGDLKRSDRAESKEGEIELAKISEKLLSTQDLKDTAKLLEDLSEQFEQVRDLEDKQKGLLAIIQKLEALTQSIEISQAQTKALSGLPQPVTLEETDKLASLVSRIERLSLKVKAVVPNTTLDLPVLNDTQKIIEVGQKIARFTKIVEAWKDLPILPDIPQLHDLTPMTRAGIDLSNRLSRLKDLKTSLDTVEKETREAHEAIERMVHEMGEICPLCGGHLAIEAVQG